MKTGPDMPEGPFGEQGTIRMGAEITGKRCTSSTSQEEHSVRYHIESHRRRPHRGLADFLPEEKVGWELGRTKLSF